MNQTRWAVLCWLVCLAVILLMPVLGVSSRWLQLFALIGINTLLAQSMNLIGGYTGQISLGHAGIYAAGAYGSAVLSTKFAWPVWLSIPGGVVIAIAVGFLVAFPANRVREFYLGMVTLGFGIVAFEVLQYWTPVTGGFMGLSNIPSPILRNLFVAGIPISTELYVAAVVTIVILFSWITANLVRSYVGRSFLTVEGSEVVASTLGINAGRTKHLAYVLSSAWAGLAGALFAHLSAFVSPESFNIWVSVSILIMAVFGGMRTLVGPLLGATFFTLLPEFTQGLQEYQYLVYGLILMMSYVLLPKGIASLLPGRSPFIDPRTARQDGLVAGQAPPPARQVDPGGLEVRGLTMQFGGVRALDGASLTVRPGTIHGLIGPNGSGKSTLVNIVTGLYRPTAGEVLFRGKPVQDLPPYVIARKGMARSFQNPQLFGDMTVRECVLSGAYARFNSSIWSCLLRARKAAEEEARLLQRSDALIDQAHMTEWRDELVKNLPYGRKRIVEIMRSLNAEPDLFILDEPAAGLSEVELHYLVDFLQDLRARGMTILLIEHRLDFLFRLVDEVTVLNHGTVIFHGLPGDSRKDKGVIESYLGSYAAA